MRSFRHLASIGICVIAALSTVGGVAGAAPERAKTVRGYSVTATYEFNSGDYMLAFVAKKQGFFATNGLDVDLQLSSARGLELLIAGRANISLVSGPPVIAADAKGASVVFVGADVNRYSLVSVSKSEIATPQDLKGKTLAVGTPGSTTETAARVMLRHLAVPSVKLQYIPRLGDRFTALSTGQVDAMIVSPPINQLTSTGKFRLLYNLASLRILGVGIATTRSYLSEHPDIIRRWLLADIQAAEWLRDPKNWPKAKQHFSALSGYTDQALIDEGFSYYVKFVQKYPTISGIGLNNALAFINQRDGTNITPGQVTDTTMLKSVLAKATKKK